MRRRIRNRLRMLRATVAHFDAHPDAWNGHPPIVRNLSPVRDVHAGLEDAALAQAQGDTTGLTQDKGDARKATTTLLVDLGRKVTAHAVEIGDDDLRQAVDHSASDWNDRPDDAFVADTRKALLRTEAILPDLVEFKVTPEHLTAIRAGLAEFIRLASLRDTTDASGTDATEDLDTLYSDAVQPLAQLDRLVPSLVDAPDFVDQYRIVRRIPGD